MERSATVQTKLVIDLDEGGHSEDFQTLLRMDSSTIQHIVKVRIESTWDDDEAIDINVVKSLFDCLVRLENLQ